MVQRRKWGSERCLDQGPRGTVFGVVEAASPPGKKMTGSSVPDHSTGVPAQQPYELGTVTTCLTEEGTQA